MALKNIIRTAAAAACLAAAGSASAGLAVATWTDWTNIGFAGATGSMGGVSVSVTATNNLDGLHQTACGTDYWAQPDAGNPAYTAGSLSNAPTPCEQVGLNIANTVTVTFGAPVTDLYMALLSVGRHNTNDPSSAVTYDFDQAFVVDSNGVGYWSGGVPGTYALGAGDTITMRELHGVLHFTSPVTSLTFSAAPTEWWHAFTFGTTSTVPEPGTLALVGAAVLGAGALRRRRGAK